MCRRASRKSPTRSRCAICARSSRRHRPRPRKLGRLTWTRPGGTMHPMLKRLSLVLFFAAIAHAIPPAGASERPVVRVGVLKFGTVSWELDVMRRHGFDQAQGIDVEPLELAGKDSAAVALQGGAVDVILTDWLWVARRRG